MSVTFSNTRTIKLPTGKQTAGLPTIIHCYLLTHCLKDGPVAAVIMANVVANVASPMSGATVPRMAKLAIGAKASIISKLSVVQRFKGCSQDGTEPSLKQEVTAAETWFHGELQWPRQRRWQPSTPEEEDTKEAAEAECVCSDDKKLGPISQQTRYRKMPNNICTGQGLMRT